MKVNKHISACLLVVCAVAAACTTKTSNQDDPPGAAPLQAAPNERIVMNNGIRYTIRYIADTGEDGGTDTIPRYLFVIGQQTEQGKNVLEYRVSDYELYARRLNYYNMEIGNDIMLVACDDTLRPAQTLYENNLGVIPENRIVAVFEKTKATCGLQLVINDRAFENYLIKATFNDK